MTSKIASYGVDLYKLLVNSGGTIDLDVGALGEVVIRGNLTVEGSTTTIESTEIAIADRIFTLNNGESGAGISTGDNTAGITVDRGSEDNVNILYDENLSWLKSSGSGFSTQTGAFVLKDSSGNDDPLIGLYTNFIGTFDDQNLILLGEGPDGSAPATSPIVTVAGTVDYEKSIWSYTGSEISFNALNSDRLATPSDADALVNVQGLRDYVYAFSLYNFQTKIVSPNPDGTTSVEVFSTLNGDASNTVTVSLVGTTSAQFTETGIFLNNLKVNNNVISSVQSNADLELSANGSGSIVTSYPLSLEKISAPSAPVDGTKIYASSEGDGGTGVYFINEDGTTDELISRSKALLLSIIF